MEWRERGEGRREGSLVGKPLIHQCFPSLPFTLHTVPFCFPPFPSLLPFLPSPFLPTVPSIPPSYSPFYHILPPFPQTYFPYICFFTHSSPSPLSLSLSLSLTPLPPSLKFVSSFFFYDIPSFTCRSTYSATPLSFFLYLLLGW